MKFKVWRKDDYEDIEEVPVFDREFLNEDIEYVAETYAEHYHDNFDGWECSWPVEFMVATEDGKILGRVKVERESRPHFWGKVRHDPQS